MIDSPFEHVDADRRRHVVVLMAVAAGQVAPSGDHQLDEDRTPW
jgi:hypothetical protein